MVLCVLHVLMVFIELLLEHNVYASKVSIIMGRLPVHNATINAELAKPKALIAYLAYLIQIEHTIIRGTALVEQVIMMMDLTLLVKVSSNLKI